MVIADVIVGSGGMGDTEEFLQVADHSDAVSVVTRAQSPGDVGVSGQGLVDDHHEPARVGDTGELGEQAGRRPAERPVLAPTRPPRRPGHVTPTGYSCVRSLGQPNGLPTPGSADVSKLS